MDVETRDGLVRLAATAKGAGMIAPGMATMLCLVTTDAGLSTGVVRSLLVREVGRTLNRISVDGQMAPTTACSSSPAVPPGCICRQTAPRNSVPRCGRCCSVLAHDGGRW